MPEPLDPELVKALAAKCWRSPVEFCRVILGDWFPTKMPWVHRGILALIFQRTEFLLDFGKEEWQDESAEWTIHDLDKLLTNFIEEGTGKPVFTLVSLEDGKFRIDLDVKRNVGVIMPRGFSKTTLLNAANVISLCYKDETFFLYVSETSGHAERQLGTVKEVISDEDGVPNNELLNTIFGFHKPKRQSANKWTENLIETLKGVRAGAVGTGGQIRGFSKGAKRPGRILFDDLENEDTVKNDLLRKAYRKWFFGTALPALRKLPTPGRAFIIGTLLHTDAILNYVIKSDRFTVVRFGAIDRQGDPLWAKMMDAEEIEALKTSMTIEGELPSYYLEYMSEYKDDMARVFPEGKLVYVQRKAHFIAKALANDPAISDAGTADYATFAVTGQEASGHKHVLDYYGQKGMDPADQADKIFELFQSNMLDIPPEMRLVGIEAVAFQRAMISVVRSKQFAMSRMPGWGSNAYFEIQPIFHGKTSKDARIKGVLKPLLMSGWLTFEEHIKVQHPELHNMFIDYPSGKKDGPDVVAMSVRLLDPFAALFGEEPLADDADPESLMTRDKAPPLLAVVGGNWRSAP